ncbi:MAG: single-stranded-DNA-specific exonuclease RecJ [Pseudomonadota bacterium]
MPERTDAAFDESVGDDPSDSPAARTVSGRLIRERPVDDRLSLTFAQRFGLSETAARLLAMRVETVDQAEIFLEPKLKNSLPDPLSFKEMDLAAGRLASAITGGEKVAIFGDYDVDGAASTAMVLRYLRHFGTETDFHIPHRIQEGYGPNAKAISALKERGAALLVTVDCGTLAFEAMDHARAIGFDAIILDHHAGHAQRPSSVAFVNPNRMDGDGAHSNLAAVGVTFLTLVATNAVLRKNHGFDRARLPDLIGFLDLVSVGTICDVVPLGGANRAFVAQGLRVVAGGGNPGLAALVDSAESEETVDAEKIAFQVGPRLNAGGRLGDPFMATRLLSTDDPGEALGLAERLDQLNLERRQTEREMVASALRSIEVDGGIDETVPIIIASGQDWHPGILGIVAGRLKDRFHKPSIALGIGEDGIAKGSGRSVPGFDLGAAIVDATEAGITLTGGGHPMAAGLSLNQAEIDRLRNFMYERAENGQGTPEPLVEIDLWISARAATVDLIAELDRLKPFGSGNPEPLIGLPAVKIANARVVGTNHVSARLKDRGGAMLQAIAFRQADTEIGEALLNTKNELLTVVGRLKRDTFRGELRVQLHIDDVGR